jgi:hypothetical protein
MFKLSGTVLKVKGFFFRVNLRQNDFNFFFLFFFWGGSRLGINPKCADCVREEEPIFENLLGF